MSKYTYQVIDGKPFLVEKLYMERPNFPRGSAAQKDALTDFDNLTANLKRYEVKSNHSFVEGVDYEQGKNFEIKNVCNAPYCDCKNGNPPYCRYNSQGKQVAVSIEQPKETEISDLEKASESAAKEGSPFSVKVQSYAYMFKLGAEWQRKQTEESAKPTT